ncbi:MAG: hypothetical protein NC301_04400 [Bacteroides sp.]|nr:hypothetical protein [Bacteroides sp.]MCM1379698.1 hypothetical protein [Bacteroides sp.]MCM1446053.1 hypothetical protein [Prevotella sp.]
MLSAFSLSAADLPDYQLEGAGTGNQGTYLVSVSVLGKKKNINDDLIARCAVHGVLFKGFADTTSRKTIRPLAGSATAEGEHADYFEKFFNEGGPATNYVTFVNSSRKLAKVGKQHKVTVTVTVNKDQLRRDLEKAGVVKSLKSMF